MKQRLCSLQMYGSQREWAPTGTPNATYDSDYIPDFKKKKYYEEHDVDGQQNLNRFYILDNNIESVFNFMHLLYSNYVKKTNHFLRGSIF